MAAVHASELLALQAEAFIQRAGGVGRLGRVVLGHLVVGRRGQALARTVVAVVTVQGGQQALPGDFIQGQAVGAFSYFVDSSAKVADVKVDGAWRTYLLFGQGPGGTFYQALDVTLTGKTKGTIWIGTDSDLMALTVAAGNVGACREFLKSITNASPLLLPVESK